MRKIQRNAKILICAALTATMIGAPFRRCRAEAGGEHGPPTVAGPSPAETMPDPLSLAAATPSIPPFALPLNTLHPSILQHTPRGIELHHALVERTVTRSLWRWREHFTFATPASDREERQRRQVAIHLGRAVSQRGDEDTAARITMIYESLRIAHWGHHADGLLGGHFNFDYSAVRCVNLDRMLPRARYGRFASLHFHHDQERVHVDTANPFGIVGLLGPVHLFLDVVGGHVFCHNRRGNS